jgi:two-component system cell cycle response regulator CpdR
MKKILVVDDDDSLRGFVAKALSKEGFDVIEAEDGSVAWDQLQSSDDIDLLLTDIVMPNMDGVELSTKAICANPDIKVMFMTGFTGMASQLDNKTTVIAKPFHLNDIVAQVQRTLEN